MEKNVLAQAAGVVVPMLASLVSVTASGLLARPLAPTVSGDVSVCEEPDVAVEKFHVQTSRASLRAASVVVMLPLSILQRLQWPAPT
jgi:hypothetical protein